jgi:hypothetical protein
MRTESSGVNRDSVAERAQRLREAGCCILPVRTDGSKSPALDTWKEYQKRLPEKAEIDAWFRSKVVGMALLCGKVSGGRFVIDIEFLDLYEEWAALVEAVRPGLLARLPLVRTPGKDESGGRHVFARSTATSVASSKLARFTKAEAKRRTGDSGKTTAIEVKGERGYVLLPGCPPACHPTGRTYEHIDGPTPEEAPDLPPERRSHPLGLCPGP